MSKTRTIAEVENYGIGQGLNVVRSFYMFYLYLILCILDGCFNSAAWPTQ